METNKNEIAIDADKLIIRIHNKIALWNNQDSTSEEKAIMLKVLAHDIVSDVISTAFSGLDGARVREQILSSTQPEKKKSAISKIFKKNK